MSSDQLSAIVMSQNDKNAYSRLLLDALEKQGVRTITPDRWVIFPLTRSVLRNRNADVIQLDWLSKFYISSDFTGYEAVDALVTYCRAIVFLMDVFVVATIGKPIVWTVHNKYNHNRCYWRAEQVVTRVVCWKADVITVKCESAATTISDLYDIRDESKIHVVADGSYVGAYPDETTRREAREKLSIPSERFVYLFFGLIRPYKGVPELISAFSNLSPPNAELWIVGKPADEEVRHELTELCKGKENVRTVAEFVPDDELQYYLNMTDVLMLPYRDILNSGTVHLGLSYGKPIVAPKLGCIPATVPRENRFLYDPYKRDALEDQLRRVYDHPKLETIGEANFRRASGLDWDESASQLADLYRDITTEAA